MKRLGIIAGLLALPLTSAWAEPEIYGRANVSFELVDEADESGTALQSNSSRLGFKGSELINDDLEVVYQLEYGVDFDDGDTFSQRNIFVGVQSDWGRVIAGYFDTPLKSAQGKLDVFNDLRGDIARTVTTNDRRASNTVMYTTPDSFGPFSANVAYISNDDDGTPQDGSDGKSASVTYNANNIYGAIAVAQDVADDDTNAVRMVGVYNLNAWQFGAMIETVDNNISVDRTEALLVSAKYQTGAWAFKAQAGQSDIIAEGTETLSLGADYDLNKAVALYGFFTLTESDEARWDGGAALDGTYLGAGIRLKF